MWGERRIRQEGEKEKEKENRSRLISYLYSIKNNQNPDLILPGIAGSIMQKIKSFRSLSKLDVFLGKFETSEDCIVISLLNICV